MTAAALADGQVQPAQAVRNMATGRSLGLRTEFMAVAMQRLARNPLKLAVPKVGHRVLPHPERLGPDQECIIRLGPVFKHPAAVPGVVSGVEMLLVEAAPGLEMSAPLSGQSRYVGHGAPVRPREPSRSFCKVYSPA